MNSTGRLDRLVSILAKLDAATMVTDEKIVDPGLGYPLLADSVMSVTGSALTVADGWEKMDMTGTRHHHDARMTSVGAAMYQTNRAQPGHLTGVSRVRAA